MQAKLDIGTRVRTARTLRPRDFTDDEQRDRSPDIDGVVVAVMERCCPHVVKMQRIVDLRETEVRLVDTVFVCPVYVVDQGQSSTGQYYLDELRRSPVQP